jgi:hypothetical protein
MESMVIPCTGPTERALYDHAAPFVCFVVEVGSRESVDRVEDRAASPIFEFPQRAVDLVSLPVVQPGEAGVEKLHEAGDGLDPGCVGSTQGVDIRREIAVELRAVAEVPGVVGDDKQGAGRLPPSEVVHRCLPDQGVPVSFPRGVEGLEPGEVLSHDRVVRDVRDRSDLASVLCQPGPEVGVVEAGEVGR